MNSIAAGVASGATGAVSLRFPVDPADLHAAFWLIVCDGQVPDHDWSQIDAAWVLSALTWHGMQQISRTRVELLAPATTLTDRQNRARITDYVARLFGPTLDPTIGTATSPISPIIGEQNVPRCTAADGAHARLKDLLRARRWTAYRTFCHEFDKAARNIDPVLIGTAPSRATLARWTAGGVKSLPYPDACRVLAAMFPTDTVESLFDLCADRVSTGS